MITSPAAHSSTDKPAGTLVELFNKYSYYKRTARLVRYSSLVPLLMAVLFGMYYPESRYLSIANVLFALSLSLLLFVSFNMGRVADMISMELDHQQEAAARQMPIKLNSLELLVPQSAEGTSTTANWVLLDLRVQTSDLMGNFRQLALPEQAMWRHCNQDVPTATFPTLNLVPLPKGTVSLTRCVQDYGRFVVVCDHHHSDARDDYEDEDEDDYEDDYHFAPVHAPVHGLELTLI